MNSRRSFQDGRRGQQASVLIIVLWIAFGLVSLALYFAHAMSLALRAADNRTAGVVAEEAIHGAAFCVSNLLASLEVAGTKPLLFSAETEAVPLGAAQFWLLGRDTNAWQLGRTRPVFDLVDEASKLNVNTATTEMLEWIPGMTPALAAAIVDWRDADSELSLYGAEDETYQRLNPPYRCKNANFDSLNELRLVAGMLPEILYGEDTNRNGILDPNENDGDASPPADNRDGKLDPGLFEYLTVWSAEANGARTNLNNPQLLATVLSDALGIDRANQVLLGLSGGPGRPGGPGGPGEVGGTGGMALGFRIRSLLEFYVRSGLTAEEFELVEPQLTVDTNAVTTGLVNVHTASETVLACIPGIGPEKAGALVTARRVHSTGSGSLAWVRDVLGDDAAIEAGPYLTARSYQFTADIVAVGHYDRGYRRVQFVFDTSDGTPRMVYRQDLTHLGWALGGETRQAMLQRRVGSVAGAFDSLRP